MPEQSGVLALGTTDTVEQSLVMVIPWFCARRYALTKTRHSVKIAERPSCGLALEDTNLPITKRVFMTATPRHYNVRNRDKEGDKKLV